MRVVSFLVEDPDPASEPLTFSCQHVVETTTTTSTHAPSLSTYSLTFPAPNCTAGVVANLEYIRRSWDECMIDNVQPLTHMIIEGYEEPRTRARRRELIDWYLRSMIGRFYDFVLLQYHSPPEATDVVFSISWMPSHIESICDLTRLWVQNMWRKGMFSNWEFRWTDNRNQGCRSCLQILPWL